MKSLFLDLGSHKGTIACVTDSSVAAITEVDHRIDDRLLTELLEKTLKSADWSYPDITRLACVAGPGGFTSLRVGVAAINALSTMPGDRNAWSAITSDIFWEWKLHHQQFY